MVKLQKQYWMVAFLFGFLWMSSAGATDSSPLTEKELKLWLASYKTIDAWGNEHEAKIEQHEEDDEADTSGLQTVEQMIKPIKAAGLYNEATSLVKKEGFKSLEQWAEITLKIVSASLAIAAEQYSGKPSTDVPAADKKLIKKYEAQIRKVSDEAEEARAANESDELEESEDLEQSEAEAY